MRLRPQVSGTARVIIGPFLDDVPCFGAVTVSLRKPPLIHFKLNLGRAFGGSLIAKPILAWLDPFLRNTLTDLLVWPNRMVFPIAEGVDLEPLEKRCGRLLMLLCTLPCQQCSSVRAVEVWSSLCHAEEEENRGAGMSCPLLKNQTIVQCHMNRFNNDSLWLSLLAEVAGLWDLDMFWLLRTQAHWSADGGGGGGQGPQKDGHPRQIRPLCGDVDNH